MALRTSVLNAIYGRGVYAVNAVPVGSVLDRMALLHPVRTEHELIRIGGDGDGGYLVPNDLSGISRCFSPGVAEAADFEEDLARRGIRSFMADYSVDSPPFSNPAFHFEKRFLGAFNSDVFTTLPDWVERHAPADDDDMILQMDIEGGEYETLLATPEQFLSRFRIIVIEIHNLRDLMTPLGNQLIGNTFQKLTRNHLVVHSHPNNCGVPFRYRNAIFPSALEVTLLRKDRVTKTDLAADFPHELDKPCVSYLPDYPLPECWRSKL
jgi:hypothetical protein